MVKSQFTVAADLQNAHDELAIGYKELQLNELVPGRERALMFSNEITLHEQTPSRGNLPRFANWLYPRPIRD